MEKKQKTTALQLVESALMIAVATVCSIVKIDLPFGGGITIVSMLPLILISHRYGWKWGVLTAFTYSLIQMILGLDNVGYATSFLMGAGILIGGLMKLEALSYALGATSTIVRDTQDYMRIILYAAPLMTLTSSVPFVLI